jgi:hypothetical protein
MQLSRPSRLPVIAISEWLMLLPAAVLLTAAALRVAQPRQYEPAHISWIIFDWATAHLLRVGAAAMFIALPALAIVAGCATLWRTWRNDQALREDAMIAIKIIRRYRVLELLTTATLLAIVILLLALAHVVTD